MSARGPTDRMLVASNDGRVCVVFEPQWWAVWRWIVWLRTPRMRRLIERRRGVRVRLIVRAEIVR